MAESVISGGQPRWLNLDLISAVGVLIGTLVLLFLVFPSQIPTAGGDELGALLPRLVCLSIMVLSIAWIGSSVRATLQARRHEAEEDDVLGQKEAVDARKQRILLATTAGYAVIVSFVGYIIASALLLTIYLWVLGERSKRVIFLLAVVLPLVINAVLARLLNVRFTEIDNFFAGLF